MQHEICGIQTQFSESILLIHACITVQVICRSLKVVNHYTDLLKWIRNASIVSQRATKSLSSSAWAVMLHLNWCQKVTKRLTWRAHFWVRSSYKLSINKLPNRSDYPSDSVYLLCLSRMIKASNNASLWYNYYFNILALHLHGQDATWILFLVVKHEFIVSVRLCALFNEINLLHTSAWIDLLHYQ